MKVRIFIGIFLVLSHMVVALIPDNSQARRQLISLLQAPVSEISSDNEQIISSPHLENSVSFEIENQNGKLYLLFINERNGKYPIVGSGTMIIRRNLDTGAIEQIKIYADDIGALIIRVRPSGRRSLVQLSLFDDILYDKIPVEARIEQIMTMNVSDIIERSNGRIPWELFFPPDDLSVYGGIKDIVREMRQIIPFLPDTEDGAMDAAGNLVRIETLGIHRLPGFNCSGFAKYVADGVYSRFGKGFMDIDSLKMKHLSLRGNKTSEAYEDTRDPYFGLDWTRNIAAEILQMQTGRHAHPEDSDIRHSDFYPYREDIGYSVQDLIQILYLESIRRPGMFYLGSINGEFGGNPQLWQHYHIVVLFPYFDSAGNFRITVMERNVETSIASLEKRYPRQFIHLVGIEPEEKFSPPRLAGE